MRIGTMVILMAILTYCAFGFAATFEPLDVANRVRNQWLGIFGSFRVHSAFAKVRG